jgi:hypothetical protein
MFKRTCTVSITDYSCFFAAMAYSIAARASAAASTRRLAAPMAAAVRLDKKEDYC